MLLNYLQTCFGSGNAVVHVIQPSYEFLVLDDCAAGDQPGIVYNHRTCQDIMTSHPSDCSRSDVKQKCCNACAQHHTFTTSTDIDGQCVNKHGAGSYMCRVRWQKRHRLIQEISFMTSNNSETSSFTICFHVLTSNVRSTICYLKSVVIGRVFFCCCCFLDDLKLLV